MKLVFFILLSMAALLSLPACKGQDVKTGKKEKAVYPPEAAGFTGAEYAETIPVSNTASALKKDWWKTAVFYECYVRSFQDSDGDGKGDLNGLTGRLDYLKALGIGGIWLMPVTKSSDRDHGYAVVDYRGIEPDYGTLDDFQRLLDGAHKRGIGVIIDFVINHSSDKHPFFMDSRSSNTSACRKWYVWTNVYPGIWPVLNDHNETWYDGGTGWYFGGFTSTMPDWNFRNDSVRAYMMDSMRFWLNRGVDGFRFDAVEHLIENGPRGTRNQPENHVFFKAMKKMIGRYDNRFIVCETDEPVYLGADEFDSGFAFGFNNLCMERIKFGTPYGILDRMQKILNQTPEGAIYSILQANHDAFAGDRPFKQFNGSLAKCKLSASLLLTLPGIPFIYYGEEIAIAQLFKVGSPYSMRTPMQWSEDGNAGFTSAEKPYRYINTNYPDYNVQTENSDTNSVLWHYRKMIRIRNGSAALNSGGFEIVPADKKERYLAFIRKAPDGSVLVVLNFSTNMMDVMLSLSATSLAGKTAAARDLFDPSVENTPLTMENAGRYAVRDVPPLGVRLIAFQ